MLKRTTISLADLAHTYSTPKSSLTVPLNIAYIKSGLGLIAGFSLMVPIYILFKGRIGAGDVKLCGVLGAAVGVRGPPRGYAAIIAGSSRRECGRKQDTAL